jgi:hypothetical protein
VHLGGEIACLLDIGVASLHPEEIGVWGELLGALGRCGEAGAVVVVSFTGAGAVARPDDRRLGVVVGQGTTAGDGEIGVLLDVRLVGLAGRLGGTLGGKVCVDS